MPFFGNRFLIPDDVPQSGWADHMWLVYGYASCEPFETEPGR